MKTKKDKERENELWNILFGIIGLVVLLAIISIICAIFVRKKDAKDKYPLDISYEYGGEIPAISRDGTRISIGIELPEVHNEWGSEEEPWFLYDCPEFWEEMYLIESKDLIVVKIQDYYLCVTPMGPVGPVWAYCRYADFGTFYGITAHYAFLFMHHGRLEVVKPGSRFPQIAGYYDDLDMLEQDSTRRGNPVYVQIPNSIEIDSLEDALVDYNEEIGVAMIANTTKEFFDVDVLQVFDGEKTNLPGKNGDRTFWVQEAEDGIGYEAMFIGAIDDYGVLFRIPFQGEIVEINEYGILHKFGDVERFTPFSPVVINGELFFAEYSPEFFDAIKGYYLKDENAPEDENEKETI